MLKKKITEHEIIDKVGDYSIFNYYFGNFDFKKHYPSVFRRDKNPSTGFFVNKEGRIVYNDFSTRETYGSITFVMKLYNLNFNDALKKIAEDFNIIESTNKKDIPKIVKIDTSKIKKERIIRVGTENWKQYHLDYWKQFSITEQELNENFVYPVKTLYIDNFAISNEEVKLKFAYKINYKGQSHLKIYSPYDPVYKWTASVPADHPFGWDELPYQSDTLIITKGQKDRIVWKKLFTDVIALQSENKICLKPEDVVHLQSNYNKIYINFDSDKPGKEAVKDFEKYGFIPVFTPDVYYEKHKIKDFADLVKEKGLKTMEAYLKWIKII